MTGVLPRLHLAEIHDEPRCPAVIRDGLTDFLAGFERFLKVYDPIRARLAKAIGMTGKNSVLDVCSGRGGPWVRWLTSALSRDIRSVTLTDKFPNRAAIDSLRARPVIGLSYLERSVDAAEVPANFDAFRTMFTSFHHFGPRAAQAILADAVRSRQPIGIFEFTYRHPLALVAFLASPLAVWAVTPFLRPLTAEKLLLTYLVPLIPLVVTWDGIVSCLRTYRPHELLDMARRASPAYHWESGTVRGGLWPLPITYLIGWPD